jgi:hypothetical protein
MVTDPRAEPAMSAGEHILTANPAQALPGRFSHPAIRSKT